MSNLDRLTLLLLASVTLLLAAACGTSEDHDGRYSSLLRLVPDDPAFRAGVTIVDYEAIRALPGYEESRPLGMTDDELAADPRALTKALGWHGVPGLFQKTLGIDERVLERAAGNWELAFGFGLGDIEVTMTTGAMLPPSGLHAISGDLNAASIRDQLDRCNDCLPAELLEHSGHEILNWGGQEINARARLALPAFDDLGRGGNFYFVGDSVVRSDFIDDLEASIDAGEGRSSLLGDDDFALLADTVDGLNLLALTVSDNTFGPTRAAEIIAAFGDNETFAPRVDEWALQDDATRLLPYQVFAVGDGVVVDEPFTAMVLVHRSDADAVANVDRLNDRLTSAGPDEATRYADLFTSTDISSDGRVLTAILRGEARMRSAFFAEPLLLHE